MRRTFNAAFFLGVISISAMMISVILLAVVLRGPSPLSYITWAIGCAGLGELIGVFGRQKNRKNVLLFSGVVGNAIVLALEVCLTLLFFSAIANGH
jgi:hypothetical protein